METKIKWNEGEGYITATYEGSGSGSASISSDVNEGIDREQSIKVETIDKNVSTTLTVSQQGLREVFEPSDGGFVLADGGTFNVFKKLYTELEYIENTGTQYIDTGFAANQDTRFVMEFMFLGVSGSGFVNLFGAGNRSTDNAYVVLQNTSNSNRFQPQFCDTYNNITTVPVKGNRYIVDFNKNVCKIDNLGSVTLTYKSFQLTDSLYIFYVNGRGMNNTLYRLYSCQIYDNDVMVRDFIPVLDSEGVPCLYDKIDNKFYYNKGSDSFLYSEI